MPYIISGIIYFRYLYIHKEGFLEWFSFYFGKKGNMVGHAGGMVGRALESISKESWQQTTVIISLILIFGLGNICSLYFNRKKSLLFLFGLYGMGAYISWLLTTTHVNDYHAVWLSFSFLSILTLDRKSFYIRIIYYCNLMVLTIFLAWGLQWTYSSMNSNQRASFKKDIDYINDALNEKIKTIHCPRDLMWEFNFKETVFDPQYYTDNAADIIVRRKFKNPTDLKSYRRYDGNRFVIFVKK